MWGYGSVEWFFSIGEGLPRHVGGMFMMGGKSLYYLVIGNIPEPIIYPTPIIWSQNGTLLGQSVPFCDHSNKMIELNKMYINLILRTNK